MVIANLYKELKEKYPDAVILFRCGDFYEVYYGDANICAAVLGITTTERDGTTMGGFPHSWLDKYLPKIIDAGYRVVLHDGLKPPRK